jgi:hypothetical protein
LEFDGGWLWQASCQAVHLFREGKPRAMTRYKNLRGDEVIIALLR